MKRILVVLTVITFAISGITCAQNSAGKADDEARISITPQVNDQAIPAGAQKLLLAKMKQICTRNGMAGDGDNPFFIMDASVDVLSKEITPTAPPMQALNLSVTFFIKDVKSGNVYSQANVEVKGVGQNETKAYMTAIKYIKPTQGVFKAMVERGKEKILEFYNSDCDFIISKAQALHKQGNNKEAIKVLNTVPQVSKECYAKCMELLAEIEPPVEEAAPAATEGDAANAETAGTANAGTSVTAGSVAAKTAITVDSKVFVEFEKESRFEYKGYSPGKVKTVASESTKNEYEILAMGDCSTAELWTADVITKWHQATKENIKEGQLVLYTFYDRDITSTVCFRIGKVVAVDELYKNLVTIKGDWNNIKKVNPEKILIIDESNIELK